MRKVSFITALGLNLRILCQIILFWFFKSRYDRDKSLISINSEPWISICMLYILSNVEPRIDKRLLKISGFKSLSMLFIFLSFSGTTFCFCESN